jgi:hypothetical protein
MKNPNFKATIVAASFLALHLHAQTTDSWRPVNTGSTNGLWSLAANWSLGFAPGVSPAPGQKADFNSNAQIPCFLNSAAFPAQLVVGDNGPGNLIILSGGSLVTSNYTVPPGNSFNALGYNSISRVEIQSGGSLISSNHLWVGQNPNAISTFVMNGGTATVMGMFGVGFNGGSFAGLGTVLMNGGTLNLAQWNPTDSMGPNSDLDIRHGTVVITSNYVDSVNNFVAAGRITGYGGVGTVSAVYDTNNNQTIVTATGTPGAGGPYSPLNWPTNINPNLFVHYYVADGSLSAPNGNWLNTLGLKNDNDQATTDVRLQGLGGKRATANNLNVFDQNWQDWNTNGLIDILLCMYGDANVLRSASDPNQGRRFQFLTGTLPTTSASTVYGGTFATNAYNSQWNWVLFTITNNLQSNLVDRLIGTLRTNATGGTNFGGINGGTIRIQGPDANANGLAVHAVAFGQHGAFGLASDINQFAAPNGSCPPVLNVNLAAIDFNAGFTNKLQVIDDPNNSQGITFASNVGPVDDQRKAVIPTSYYLNFGIISNYLGQPCNDSVTAKVCVDYYDDPAFAGNSVFFGPQTYAIDSLGDTATLPTSSLALLQGTGKWIRQSWTIPNVNLYGVNTAPLTGGPQFISVNGQVAVSRYYLAALRTVGPLAGQDPLADCYGDPLICQGAYGNYAELDLGHGVTNGLDLGSSSGDQTFVVETAGPAGDLRLSVRGDTAPNYFLNFQVVTNALGPTSEGNLHLAMVVTYYDDPAQAGEGFRPQVWKYQQATSTPFNFMPASQNVILQGSGQWRDAYWEIGTISLNGVNQSPQAAARFQTDPAPSQANALPVHVSRVRYAVIRPCGPTAGQNLLSTKASLSGAPETNSLVKISWPYRAPQAVLESAPSLNGSWSAVGTAATIENAQSVVRLSPTNASSQFFRLTLTPP